MVPTPTNWSESEKASPPRPPYCRAKTGRPRTANPTNGSWSLSRTGLSRSRLLVDLESKRPRPRQVRSPPGRHELPVPIPGPPYPPRTRVAPSLGPLGHADKVLIQILVEDRRVDDRNDLADHSMALPALEKTFDHMQPLFHDPAVLPMPFDAYRCENHDWLKGPAPIHAETKMAGITSTVPIEAWRNSRSRSTTRTMLPAGSTRRTTDP